LWIAPAAAGPSLSWATPPHEVEGYICGSRFAVEGGGNSPNPEVEHLPSEASFTFTVEVPKHETRTSVSLDPPPPYAPGQPFTAIVGVECITVEPGCNLECNTVEVYDHLGVLVGTGHLITPYMAPAEINIASVDLVAPPEEGTYTWTARYLGGSSPSGVLHSPSKVRISVRRR